ncbi:MAG: hypothetical protein LAT63_17360 [Marinobacter sp.]|nr:hypothetical protein [Marinobacter sp.]
MDKPFWLIAACALVSSQAFAASGSGMQPLTDDMMANVTGQAFISVDRQYHPDQTNTTSYTRVNLGMDIEIQTNIDVLELGRYDRPGERPGTSDLYIENFGLGYINNQAYFQRNRQAPRQLRPDGTAYQEGDIVPFHISNPFLEFAFDEAANEVVGFRIGFGEAMGILSGDIKSLTGNINIDIVDRGDGMRQASSSGNFFDQIIVLLTPLLEGDSPIRTKAELVYGAPGHPNLGERDPIRGEYVGIPNGERFILEGAGGFTRWSLKNLLGWGSSSQIEVPNCSFFSCGGGDIYVYVQNCEVLGITACFDLDMYNSFPVGQIQEVGNQRRLAGPATGTFISVQTQDLDWLADVSKTNPNAADFVRATSGAFFNIPNGATEVNLYEALFGVERYRAEYIDRGRGLF